MRIKLLLVFSIIYLNSVAQKTVNHKVVYDDPDKENLAVSVDYFIAEFYTGNEERNVDGYAGLGYGFQLSYMNLFNKLQAELNWRRNYKFSGDLHTAYLDAGVTWDISKNLRTRSMDIRLGSAGNNRDRYMSGVKVTQANRFRARAGLTHSNVMVQLPPVQNVVSPQARVSRTGLYIGLEYMFNRNYKTLVNLSQSRREADQFRIYADVIGTAGGYGKTFSPSIYYGDQPQIPITDELREEWDSIGVANSIGYRLGVKYVLSMPNGFNFNFDSYVGQKPPYLGIYAYIGCGITVNIATAFQKNNASSED